ESRSAEQQACALRPSQSLAAGKGHEVETQLRVLPQIVDRRYVGGSIVQSRNAVFLPDLDELFVADPSFRVVVVVEEHHRGLWIDRALRLFPRLHLHSPHAALAAGMV